MRFHDFPATGNAFPATDNQSFTTAQSIPCSFWCPNVRTTHNPTQDLATNDSEDGCGAEHGEVKRVLPRMLARGDIFNAGIKEDSKRGGEIGGRARTSFFLSKRSVLSSSKRSFRSTGEASAEAAEVEEEKNISYDPCSSYGHTTVEGTNSRGDAGAWEIEVSESSERCDTYPRTPPRTMAM